MPRRFRTSRYVRKLYRLSSNSVAAPALFLLPGGLPVLIDGWWQLSASLNPCSSRAPGRNILESRLPTIILMAPWHAPYTIAVGMTVASNPIPICVTRSIDRRPIRVKKVQKSGRDRCHSGQSGKRGRRSPQRPPRRRTVRLSQRRPNVGPARPLLLQLPAQQKARDAMLGHNTSGSSS